jgi:hypothetical protein
MEMKRILFYSILTLLMISSVSSRAEVNLRLNAGWVLLGATGIEADFKAGDHWTVGPAVAYWDLGAFFPAATIDWDLRLKSAGLQTAYYFEEVFKTGQFLRLRAAYAEINVSANDLTFGRLHGRDYGMGTSLLYGYQLFLGTNFNVSLAGGVSSYSYGAVDMKDGTGTKRDSHGGFGAGTGLNLEFNVSYLF